MKIGFSLSPGGLLFPYHIGVLTSLTQRGYLTSTTPLAGSSAGAIAVASHAAGIDPYVALDGCIKISKDCMALGGARGRLIPLLERELHDILPEDAHEIVNDREGLTGLAYREIFPRSRSVLQSRFESREDLIEAVCNSSMFPFFSTNGPCLLRIPRRQQQEQLQSSGMMEILNNSADGERHLMSDDDDLRTSESSGNDTSTAFKSRSLLSRLTLPRLIVDGYFTVERNRFGCPIIPNVEREVTVSVFPHELIGLDAQSNNVRNQISPSVDSDFAELLRGATQASTAREHREMFDRGYSDGERWANNEER